MVATAALGGTGSGLYANSSTIPRLISPTAPVGMVFGMDAELARKSAYRCYQVLEPVHAASYFAPEVAGKLAELGITDDRAQYFAMRAAPFGAIGPGVVTATFYNFNPDLIAKSIPDTWRIANPSAVVAARLAGATESLYRLLGTELAESAEVTELATLLGEAVAACRPEGRPLYAAHADLAWPSEPIAVVWHAASLLREYRGDGHIALLVAAELPGLDALVTHTVTGKGFTEKAARELRGWTEGDWAAARSRLVDRGLLTDAGALSSAGQRLRDQLETETNTLATAPWHAIGPDGVERVREIGTQLRTAVLAGGGIPRHLFASGK